MKVFKDGAKGEGKGRARGGHSSKRAQQQKGTLKIRGATNRLINLDLRRSFNALHIIQSYPIQVCKLTVSRQSQLFLRCLET